MSKDDKVCVGAVAGAFGVRGELRLKSFCSTPEDIATYSPVTDETGKTHDLKITRAIKGAFAARLSGIHTKEEADAQKGLRLYVPRDRLPDLPDDEFYHSDLIGLEVYDTGGAHLGKIRAVHDHGAGDLLEVFGAGRKTTALIPFTREIVPTVDITAGRVIVDPPEGLF